MKSTIKPGLYAIGKPDENSDVFVSANYKLSFDHLRKHLGGKNFWILVLDTKGINVWCAAGKGTFGTDELILRANQCNIKDIINHNRIIVPQLGGPGINAPLVAKTTGLKVHYGPVQAHDLNSYIQKNYTATIKMRTITFSLKDRFILTPMELNPFLKKFPWFAVIMLTMFSLHAKNPGIASGLTQSLPHLVYGLAAIFAGAFITPLLLPIIPFRSFSLKGLLVGLAMVAITQQFSFFKTTNMFELIFSYLFYAGLTSYIAVQFTGSTTFTHLSGVKKELKYGLPIYIGSAAISIILLAIFLVATWRA